jgi:fructosamine-3-kinase
MSEPLTGAEAELRRLAGFEGDIQWTRVSGGDIHQAWRARTGAVDWFVKVNRRAAHGVLRAEYRALQVLRKAGVLRVPQPHAYGRDATSAWLLMEHFSLCSNGDAAALGDGLAALHRVEGPAFGWSEDNFVGTTPQANGWLEYWPEFWWRRRLEPQWRLAREHGHGQRLDAPMQALRRALPALLAGHCPRPSLLHGDLWGGNHAYLPDGVPVIFDPASWYGDRETDLAMTELFGGFDPRFRQAYEAAWPLPAGHERRRDLYQLYHLLNHLNLFGGTWLPRVESTLTRLVRPPGP